MKFGCSYRWLISVLLAASSMAMAATSNDVGLVSGGGGGGGGSISGPMAVSASGTFAGSEAATVDGRLLRDGIQSTCAPAKAYPGAIGSGPHAYKTHVLYNAGPAQCVTVNFDVGTCDFGVHLAAYAGSFDPSNFATNYLWDVGSTVTQSFSFQAAANSAVVLVAFDNNGTAARCTYSYQSNQLSVTAGATSVTNVPTLSEWAMIIMASLMVFGAVVVLRRR